MSSLSPLALLHERVRSGSSPGSRADDAHLALVLEGGGMRGVVSIAMASALEERGCTAAFDSVHGSSAGACGAAYFAAGQANLGARIYFEDINNRRFIDTLRPLRGRAVMDKDFLIEHVMRRVKPLDCSAIIAAPGFLNVIATKVTTGDCQRFDTFRDARFLLDALKASICLPLIAGRSVMIRGQEYVDGGIVQQIAVESAAAKGATHAIVLMTRAENEIERPLRKGLQLDTRVLRACYGRPLAVAYRERNGRINETLRALATGRFKTETREVLVDSVSCRQGSTQVERLTTDGRLLRSAYAAGRSAAFSFLGQ